MTLAHFSVVAPGHPFPLFPSEGGVQRTAPIAPITPVAPDGVSHQASSVASRQAARLAPRLVSGDSRGSRSSEQDDFFTGLVNRYAPALRAYAARRLSIDTETAEDVVQTVFLRAWRWRHCLMTLTPLQCQVWLTRTTQRCVVDVWRQRRGTHQGDGVFHTMTFTHLAALYGGHGGHGRDTALGTPDEDTPDDQVERALGRVATQVVGAQHVDLGMRLDEAVCTRLVARERLAHLLTRLSPEEARLLLRVAAGVTTVELQAESANCGKLVSRTAIRMRVKRARASARRVWAALADEGWDNADNPKDAQDADGATAVSGAVGGERPDDGCADGCAPVDGGGLVGADRGDPQVCAHRGMGGQK